MFRKILESEKERERREKRTTNRQTESEDKKTYHNNQIQLQLTINTQCARANNTCRVKSFPLTLSGEREREK